MNKLTINNTGESLSFYTATLSQRLDNWLWDFSAEVNQETFNRFKPKKSLRDDYIAVSLKTGNETWQLIVDGFSSNDTNFSYSIKGFSKTAILGEPFAEQISAVWRGVMAKTIVQQLCDEYGVVLDWQVPDWPVNELVASKNYPIDIILKLVGSDELNAAVLAKPNGTLSIVKNCINPKNLQSLSHDFYLATDKNLFERSYQFINNKDNFNQISVINDLAVANNASLSVSTEQSGDDWLIKAYPSPFVETVTLTHTSGDNVDVFYEGIKTEQNSDNILLKDGKGNLSKSYYSLNSLTWQQDETGVISINAAGDVDCTSSDLGLVTIDYNTRYHQFRIQKLADIDFTGGEVTAEDEQQILNESITLVFDNGGRIAESVIIKTLSTADALLFRAESELFRQVYDAEERQIICAYEAAPLSVGKIARLKINAEAMEFNGFITAVGINLSENEITQSVTLENYLV